MSSTTLHVTGFGTFTGEFLYRRHSANRQFRHDRESESEPH
jgi:hypothetical protein